MDPFTVVDRPAPSPATATELAYDTGSHWEPAWAAAPDGIRLDGWLFTPSHPNGGGVIVMHGVGDTRESVIGHARFLLRAGYTVLMPDARGHGASGGRVVTYGIRETGDVHAWADWLLAHHSAGRLYGLGVSMGASVLLEALGYEGRFHAVVADCPFASFEEIAADRFWQYAHIPRSLAMPMVKMALLYPRARYGVDVAGASPIASVRATATPVLLIHGTDDDNVPIRHSRELHAANPAKTRLLEVPGAGHAEALEKGGEEYVRAVLDWFERRDVEALTPQALQRTGT